MRHRLVFTNLLLTALFLALAPAALASTKWYVDGVNGNDNNNCKTPQTACKTIGHAISLAHSGDSVRVAPATYTENLTISVNLKLVGSGASTTIIDGGSAGTVVTIPTANAHVALSNITIRNGHASQGGGVYNTGTLAITNSTLSANRAAASVASGGGIFNSGTLTINKGTLSGNIAEGGYLGSGGGIASGGTLTINNTTVSGNNAGAAREAFGGGIVNSGTLAINNSTISGNVTGDGRAIPGKGGGIYSIEGTLTLNSATLSSNSAHSGGGIYNDSHSAITVQNNIIANSPLGGNCDNHGTMTSNGYNLSDDNTCNFNGPGDLNNTDPKLGQLGNYGGPTQTIPLLSGSPAIEAGNPSGCTDGNGHLLKTDQRGRPRPDKEDTGGCDMGAYERQKD
jgi:hypothetical protein